MEKHWFDSTPPHSRRTLCTVVGSVLLHGSLIAVAALYPVSYAPPPPMEVPLTALGGDPAPPVVSLPSAPNFPESTPPEPEPPTLAEAPTDIAPPTEDLTMADPVPPKPASRTGRSPHAPAAVNPQRQRGLPGGATGARGETGAMNSGYPGTAGRWNTPQPPYLYAMRMARVQGSGSVRITTDGSGRVVSASVAQSTGSALLDDNTVRFARTHWSGPPNASVTVPITYQIR